MSAPDFYFAINAVFRHLHDKYGHDVLIDYWQSLGREYYRSRWQRWREGGAETIASDWQTYFEKEPNALVSVSNDKDSVQLEIQVCPAIKHLKDNGRVIAPYFCQHCDHTCAAMAQSAGFLFERTGGMGTCRQRFIRQSENGRGI